MFFKDIRLIFSPKILEPFAVKYVLHNDRFLKPTCVSHANVQSTKRTQAMGCLLYSIYVYNISYIDVAAFLKICSFLRFPIFVLCHIPHDNPGAPCARHQLQRLVYHVRCTPYYQ